MDDTSVMREIPHGREATEADSAVGATIGEPRPEPSRPTVRRSARPTFTLLAIFTVTYFGTAVLTSAALTDLAALRVAGAPLGFLLGLVVIVVGLVVTRVHLTRGED